MFCVGNAGAGCHWGYNFKFLIIIVPQPPKKKKKEAKKCIKPSEKVKTRKKRNFRAIFEPTGI